MRRVAIEKGDGASDTAAAELAALRRAAETLGSSVDLDRVAAHSLDEVMALLGARSGSLHVASPHGSELLRRAAVNMPDAMLPPSIASHYVKKWIGESAPGVFDLDGTEQRPRQAAAWAFGIRRIVFVPLGDVAHPVGLMTIGLTETGPVHQSLIETLAAVARLQLAAIANASAHEQQRLASQRLEEEHRRFTATVEHLPIAIHILNRQGEYVMLNRAAREFQRDFFGADHDSSWTERAMQIGYFSLDGKAIPMSELPLARGFAGEVLPGVEIRMVSPFVPREMYAIVSAVPIRYSEAGVVEEVAAVVLDVTTQRGLAEAKDRFLRIASHELRSPLTSLRATTGLLELDPSAIDDPARRESLLKRINRQVDRLTHLIDQLLDSARLHSKELPLQPEAANLDELCREAMQYLGPDAQGRAVEIIQSGDLAGRWDRLRIEQLVTNLVNNAVRHSPTNQPVVVTLRGEARECHIEVADRGIGVPTAQLERLFTPFFRASNAPPRGGIGLGLYISSEIVRRHGGKITAGPRPDGGMVFTVTLPRLFNQDAEQRDA